ncbi:PTS system, IIA component [Pseudodesulfovibrio profundus]|jgi:mannitol/fructose-specific phosphotransferase system IIA component (Ntr-type)|uniref:PTS system, IIA component n=1 Tax=Pseudodesulfovibrio profundus TaxID=57320 RepID=A0A2C8F5Z6_9BACT|nr:PTS sugar transporter subunit IIA [Pseudodesulfovibrio profundus]SOB57454.1 PTS system, IIA component [Pseudodesulfovibrio profundus]
MDTILDAIQEGRLFELPENDKWHALQFLAHIIEAFPETTAGTDVVGLVAKREEATNTAIGKGWACPHARLSYEEDLMCVIGWSPKGIDYGAPDGIPVSLVVMYMVPDNQRNHYLREVSILAKTIDAQPGLEKLCQAKNLDDVRHYLLDLVETAKGAVGPDARAKMIRLQTRETLEKFSFRDLSNLICEPVTLVAAAGSALHIALTQNGELAERLDSASDVIEKMAAVGVYQTGDWRLLRRATVNYPGGRVTYDCLAIKIAKDNSRGGK